MAFAEPMRSSPSPWTGTDKLALALLGLLILLQVVTTTMTLHHYPDGFWVENFYHPAAVNLLQHGIYGFGKPPNIEPTTFRPPLYSLVLAGLYGLFGVSEVVGIVFNNVLLTLTVALTFMMGRRLSATIGLLAAIGIVLDSIYLAEANRNQSDLLFTFLVVLGLYCAMRSCDRPLSLKWVAAAALAFALATFTRAAGLYIWPLYVFLLLMVHWRHALKRNLLAAAVLAATINAAFILPWMARNESLTGNSDYAGMKGYHITNFYAPLFIARRDGITYAEAKRRIGEGFNTLIAGRQLTPGEREILMNEYGSKLVRDNWVDALLVLPSNVPRMFFSYASETLAVLLGDERFAAWHARYQSDHAQGNTPTTGGGFLGLLRYYMDTGLIVIIGYGALVKVLTVGVLVLGGIGCLRLMFSRDPRRFSVGMAIFLICGILTATSIIATQGRFRLPVMPGLAIAAAFVLTEAWAWLRASRGRRLAAGQA